MWQRAVELAWYGAKENRDGILPWEKQPVEGPGVGGVKPSWMSQMGGGKKEQGLVRL